MMETLADIRELIEPQEKKEGQENAFMTQTMTQEQAEDAPDRLDFDATRKKLFSNLQDKLQLIETFLTNDGSEDELSE
jgi:hypothetical protein